MYIVNFIMYIVNFIFRTFLISNITNIAFIVININIDIDYIN